MTVLLVLAALAVALALVRAALGPTGPDRVAALELAATAGVGLLAVVAMVQDAPVVLDIAAVLALVGFLGTLAFARYLEERS